MGGGAKKIAMRTNDIKGEETGKRLALFATYFEPLCGCRLEQAKTFVNRRLDMVFNDVLSKMFGQSQPQRRLV